MSDAPSGLIGPLLKGTYYHVLLDGKVVPYIEVIENEDKTFMVIVDGRMGINVKTQQEIMIWMYVVANGMAVAAGYPCFGAENKSNPFNRKMTGISLHDIEPPPVQGERRLSLVKLHKDTPDASTE